jgi:hypothetical protein
VGGLFERRRWAVPLEVARSPPRPHRPTPRRCCARPGCRPWSTRWRPCWSRLGCARRRRPLRAGSWTDHSRPWPPGCAGRPYSPGSDAGIRDGGPNDSVLSPHVRASFVAAVLMAARRTFPQAVTVASSDPSRLHQRGDAGGSSMRAPVRPPVAPAPPSPPPPACFARERSAGDENGRRLLQR